MVINFEKLKFKNILSFGEIETEIDFTKGLNLISGKNGSGKSAILDALSFCLFGKPYRDIKIKELLNRKNRKDLQVVCTFTVDGKNQYQVKRTLNPDSLEIIKNGTESDLLSSKKLNQEELNKIIGINYQLFKQVISLAVNYNKPFLSLPIWEKREIIEQIFNITVFGQMLKLAKKKNTDNIVKDEMNKSTVKILEENLKALWKNIKEITEATTNFESTKAEELASVDKRIEQYTDNAKAITKQIESVVKNLEKYEGLNLKEKITDAKKNLSVVVKSLTQTEFSIEEKVKDMNEFEIATICPRCNTELSQEHKDKEITKLKIQIEDMSKEVDSKEIEKCKLSELLSAAENDEKEYSRLMTEKKGLSDKKNLIDNEIFHLTENRQKILDRKIEIDVDKINNEFNKKKEEYKDIDKNSTILKSVIKNYEIIFEVLSETGIKAFFFRKLIPILNTKVNEYLQLFEIPILLLFDEFMNEKITNYENMRDGISYCSYSEGEKKRIDMSILLSFISMTKTISNWNCNLLLIDELLDGAIDENGLDKLVSSLKSMTHDTNMCIYIISHRLQQDYSSRFNKCLQIDKVDSFSTISYI